MSNVVGDVAGQYLTLKALLDKMPQGELICLGDPNDRGPRSKEVIEYLMLNGRTVFSNHAHMLVEEWRQQAMPGVSPMFYEPGLMYWNGGQATLESYTGKKEGGNIDKIIPYNHIDWLAKCPMYIEEDNFVMSHAPLHINLSLEEASDLGGGFYEHFDHASDFSLIWNRKVPDRIPKGLNGKVNVFGHNASNMVKIYCKRYPQGIKVDQERYTQLWNERNENPIWAICIDTSSNKVLTGLHLPTMTIYQQEYID